MPKSRQASIKVHEIVDSAVDQYRAQNPETVPSWSQGLQQLALIGFHYYTRQDPTNRGWFGGSEEAEKEIMQQYESWCDERDEPEADFIQFVTEHLISNWGGKRD